MTIRIRPRSGKPLEVLQGISLPAADTNLSTMKLVIATTDPRDNSQQSQVPCRSVGIRGFTGATDRYGRSLLKAEISEG